MFRKIAAIIIPILFAFSASAKSTPAQFDAFRDDCQPRAEMRSLLTDIQKMETGDRRHPESAKGEGKGPAAACGWLMIRQDVYEDAKAGAYLPGGKEGAKYKSATPFYAAQEVDCADLSRSRMIAQAYFFKNREKFKGLEDADLDRALALALHYGPKDGLPGKKGEPAADPDGYWEKLLAASPRRVKGYERLSKLKK